MIGTSGRRRLLRGGVFAAFAALAVVLWSASTGVVNWPRGFVYRVILVSLAILNVAWWLRADLRLAQGRRRGIGGRVGRLLLACYMVVMLAPLLGMVRGSLDWRRLPTFAVMWVQLWHMLIVLTVPLGAAIGVVAWTIGRIRRRLRGRPTCNGETVDSGRRLFLRQAIVAAPVVIAGGFTAGGLWQLNQLAKRRWTISPPGLPDRLKGLTITHLSDFHIGRLYQVGHFRRAVDEANRFDSDIVVITGDLVDHSNEVLPEALATLQGLRHRYGLFLCLGNHDLIDDGEAYVDCLREAGLALLVNERRELRIGGERLDIGGLMWARRHGGPGHGLGHEDHVAATFGTGASVAPAPFTIALAHHPHAFDATARRGVSLTLSGHTHGGQLMLTPPGWPELGAGNLLFRYIRGFYSGDGTTEATRQLAEAGCVRSERPLLFVNAGAGNWFPVRLNAPAEIVQLRLI